MMDLFGMNKATQDPQQPQQEPPEPRKPQAGSHGLWLFLLVLDSIFVIVFGGAVAAKVYQYWKAPPAAVAPVARRRPSPKPPEPAKAPEPAPAPKPAAPVVEAAKPAAKPEAKISRRGGETPRPPKPSLITEAPRPRATPGLATSGSAARAASPAAPTKALPVVFKLRASKAASVQLVGAFIVHGGRKEMTKGSHGNWSVKLYLNPGQYRYFFSVDKKKTLDPENPNSDRGASLLTVP